MRRIIFFFFGLLFQYSYCVPCGIIDFSLQTCVDIQLSALIVPTDGNIVLYGTKNEYFEVPLIYEKVTGSVKHAGLLVSLEERLFDTHEIFIKDVVSRKGLFKITIRRDSGLPLVTLESIDKTRKYALYKALPSGGSDSFVIAIGNVDSDVSVEAVKKHQPSGNMISYSRQQ